MRRQSKVIEIHKRESADNAYTYRQNIRVVGGWY